MAGPFTSADPNAFLALGMQSAKGTPQVTLAKTRFIKYVTGNDAAPQTEVVDLREGGDGLDFGYSFRSNFKGAGQIVMNARPEPLGQLLAGVLGGATWGGASLPAVHTFHAGHASFPYFTILAGHPGTDLAQIFKDAKFTGFEIEAMAGQPLKITAPWVSLGAGASAVFPAATFHYVGGASVHEYDPFLYHHTPSILVDGVADSAITGWKISAALSAEELQAQAVTLDEVVIQNRALDIELTRRYDVATGYGKILYGGGIAPTNSVATGAFRAIHVIPGAPTRTLDLRGDAISWRSDALTEMDPDGKTVYETISGRVLRGATHALIALLSNAHASAYGP